MCTSSRRYKFLSFRKQLSGCARICGNAKNLNDKDELAFHLGPALQPWWDCSQIFPKPTKN